jgi:tetratricopeptide (TPR) repeat protein
LIPRWSISAGELFELTRPASFALSALISTWVFASARRRGFPLYAALAWALTTLFYTLIILPIYLIVRASRRRTERSAQKQRQEDTDSPFIDSSLESTSEPISESTAESISGTPQPERKLRLRFMLPLLYLLAVVSLGALFYYMDLQTIDAHLARANRARLLGQRDKTIREYRAALKLEDNAHTHNLLGIELAAGNQLEEALAEFRAAERENEPDDALFYRIATTLDALNRTSEAAPEYQKFLGTRLCTQSYPDPQCAAARARVESRQ